MDLVQVMKTAPYMKKLIPAEHLGCDSHPDQSARNIDSAQVVHMKDLSLE